MVGPSWWHTFNIGEESIVTTNLHPSEIQRIAEEAYIYGFAIVENF
jgi:hypothetical protein